MRRCLAALLLVLFASSAAHAQIRYGVKGGVTFATVDPDLPGYDYRLGLAVGAFLEWPLGSRFALQPEVLFNQKGSSIDSDLADAKLRIDYLEVPILGRFNLTSSAHPFFVFGGAAFAFKLRAETAVSFAGDTIKDDVGDDIEDVDWGLVAGGGKEFSKFFVEGRYTHGMKTIDKLGDTIKNRAITALAGFRF